jgi:hypothetical protein
LVAVALLGAATLYQDQRRRGLSLEAAEAATRETNERAALKLALKAVELAPTEPAIRVLTTKLQAMLRPEYILPRPSVFLVSESEEHVAWADVIGRAFILDRRKNERHPICGFIYPVDELRFVPRNDFVVGFTAKDDYLQILDPTTGRRTGAASVRGPRVRLRMSVADNGATLVLTSYSKPTQRFRIPTLELIDETPAGALEDPQPDYKPRWRDVRTPLFSPSRDRFVQILENTLYAHSALGGEELWHADGAGLKEVAYSPDGSLVIAWGRDDLAASVAMFSSRDGKLLTRSPPHKLFSRRFQGTLFLDRSFELLPIGAQSKRMYFKSDYSLYVYDLDTGAHLATISTIDEQMDSTEARLSQLTNSPTRADLLALGRSLLNDCEVLR